jgi:hypothetical protein
LIREQKYYDFKEKYIENIDFETNRSSAELQNDLVEVLGKDPEAEDEFTYIMRMKNDPRKEA